LLLCRKSNGSDYKSVLAVRFKIYFLLIYYGWIGICFNVLTWIENGLTCLLKGGLACLLDQLKLQKWLKKQASTSTSLLKTVYRLLAFINFKLRCHRFLSRCCSGTLFEHYNCSGGTLPYHPGCHISKETDRHYQPQII